MTRLWFGGPARRGQSRHDLPSPPRPGPRRRVLLRLEAVEDRTVTSAALAESPPLPDLGLVADKPIIVGPADPVPITEAGAASPDPQSLAADSPATPTSPVGAHVL